MNGAPGSSRDVLETASDQMKQAKVCVKSVGPISSRSLSPRFGLSAPTLEMWPKRS